jgi:hypothetical protein
LRPFGSTLMLFPFICAILFIRVICGSRPTVFLPQKTRKPHGKGFFSVSSVVRFALISASLKSGGCRYEIASQIVEAKTGCLFSLKGNRERLLFQSGLASTPD